MKRFISILLAIMLVTALIPTSFAAEKNAEVHTNSYSFIINRSAFNLEQDNSSPQDIYMIYIL